MNKPHPPPAGLVIRQLEHDNRRLRVELRHAREQALQQREQAERARQLLAALAGRREIS